MRPDLSQIDDPRGPWEFFRRKALEYICRSEGIFYPPGEPAHITRLRLQSESVDPNKYSNLMMRDALRGYTGRQEVQKVKFEKPKANNYESMKMHELRTKAKELGVKINPSMKKAEIIGLLENGQNAS